MNLNKEILKEISENTSLDYHCNLIKYHLHENKNKIKVYLHDKDRFERC